MKKQTGRNRVLIIEDDAALRLTIGKIAEAAGFTARETDDAAVVSESIATWQPSLVILDLQMPGRDGVEMLSDLGADGCDAAVDLSSGADERILEAAVRVGRERGLNMAGTLQKPFQLDDLRNLLRRFAVSLELTPHDLAEGIS